jgi:heme O synthase-like polyprenyltransferase
MMTFGIKYADDYREAGVPIFPNRYGVTVTRAVIGLSTGAAVVMMLWAMYLLHLNPVLMWSARVLGCLLFGFTVTAIVLPKPKLNFLLYKSASVYMLGSMLILIFGA